MAMNNKRYLQVLVALHLDFRNPFHVLLKDVHAMGRQRHSHQIVKEAQLLKHRKDSGVKAHNGA